MGLLLILSVGFVLFVGLLSMGDSINLNIGSLTLVFIVLKLCDVIDWSWFWVLSPILLTLIVGFLIWFIVRWVVSG